MVLVDLVVCTRACLALARSHFHSYFPLNFILRTSEIVAGDVKKLGIQFRINLSVEIPIGIHEINKWGALGCIGVHCISMG